MNDELNIRSEKTVDRAVRELLELPVPPGPPAETLRSVLNAGRERTDSPGQTRLKKRRFTMNLFAKIAAVILVVAGIGGMLYWLTVGEGGASSAWADMQKIIRNAQSMTWRMEMSMTMPMPNGETTEMIEMTMHSDCFYKQPGLVRQETTVLIKGEEITTITVVDFSTEDGRMVTLIPSQKMAVTANLGDLSEEVRDQQKDFLGELKKLIEGSNQPLGEKEIDGRTAQGFRVNNMGYEMDIWVDPGSGLPVLMEGELPGLGKMAMMDFAFDVEIDDELFDLTVPEGYKKRPMALSLGDLTEDDLIEGLRFLATHNKDTFPPSPMITSDIMKDFMEKAMQEWKDKEPSKEPSKEEGIKFGGTIASKLTRMMMFIQVKSKQTWRYAGGGVELGDAEAPVCWYKPKDSETYRVVYGDLSVKDVAEDDLPPDPNDAGSGSQPASPEA